MSRTLIRLSTAVAAGVVAVALAITPAFACGGLVAPNGTVRLLRTSTLAAWHDGVEHYVTSFQFAGGGAEFGSIIPLPGIPTSVERGGDWTLQRLAREVAPPAPEAKLAFASAGAADTSAQVLLEKRIDALDITILKGGGAEVGQWAKDHGFALTPDAPEVLDFYSGRSPIFMAARFDAAAARDKGQGIGDGTPIHLTIPTDAPWVPLRILALGRGPNEPIDADVFLLTDTRPELLAVPGTTLERSEPASDSLLTDLHNDKGMDWVPSSMWLSFVRVSGRASVIEHDLAVNAHGAGFRPAVDPGIHVPVHFASLKLANDLQPESPLDGLGWLAVVGAILAIATAISFVAMRLVAAQQGASA